MSTNNYKPSEMANAIRSIGKMPVNIQDILTPEDEGKVVNNNTLVVQTAHEIVTENGTIDTSLNNSVTINVNNNPNYIETIEGTLANPFGERFVEIASEAVNNSVSLELSFTLVGVGSAEFPLVYDPTGEGVFHGSVTTYGAHQDSFRGMSIYYYPPESVPDIYAFLYENDTLSDLTDLIAPETISTTLTIIHHHMSDSGT